MTPGKKPSQSSRLERKIAAYTLAGAAAIAAPAVAQAGTIDYFPGVNTNVTQPGTYVFNLSGPSAGDITLTATTNIIDATDPGNTVNFSAANGAMVAVGGGPFSGDATPFNFGDIIDPSSVDFNTSGKLGDYDTVTLGTSGGWTPGTDGYLGFYFEGTGGPQAGWAEISIGSADLSFEVLSYAYETVANTTIQAGQTTDTPEPSTLALVALGGAGLIALRRRRAARG
jgi:hypothetical protein